MTLDENLGFKKNPFSLKSSEQELAFLDEIFYEPNYYQTLKSDLASGVSEFVIGQRGHGKSSIINKLLKDLEKNLVFTIKLDRFDSIPIKKNETALIKLILKHIVTRLCFHLYHNRKKIKNLDASEKEKLAFFHQLFYGSLSRVEYENVYNKFRPVKKKNALIRFFNKIGIVPLNSLTSAAVNLTSSTISKSIGLDSFNSKETYIEYFGTIEELKFEKLDIDKQEFSKESLKQILDDVLDIVKKIGFTTTVILIDKIDEFQDLNQDIIQIANFTKEILSDTELLMNDKLAIAFSLWSELRTELAGKVRFDKFGIIDVRWLSKDLEPLINQRIKYFSINENLTLENLIVDSFDREELIKLANKSPCDLLSALSEIYQEQSNTNQNATHFDSNCILNGLINFCKKYDYDSVYPFETGKNKEITAMINRLLTMRVLQFSTNRLNEAFKQKSSQSIGQIKLMVEYKLIREEEILGPNNYEIIDPKVEFLIRRGISKMD